MLARRTNVLLAAAALAAVAAMLTAAVAACGGAAASSVSPSSSGPAAPAGGPAAGTKLAPGMYDLEDGTVRAVGTVEYRDLEGGFWAVLGGTEAESDVGKAVVVVVNGADYHELFAQNEGLSFLIDGTRAEGASTRMAGPEITATNVTLASDAVPAE
jgi:hypothetical protein